MPPQDPTEIHWRSYRRPKPPVSRYVVSTLWTALVLSAGLSFCLLYYSVNHPESIAQQAS